jgi:glycosyltransferase
MKISVITVVYNNKTTIENAVNSVFSQNYPKIEYIVVDGGSTDGTMEVLNKHKGQIAHLVSERDNGIYDAMNKGLRLASGDVVGILNSDDFYVDSNVISDIAAVFENYDIDCCYGDLEYVDYHDTIRVVRKWKSKPFKQGLFKTGWHPPHPTFFVRREIYEKFGGFDLDFNISADYELMLRLLEKYNIESHYIPRVLVRMRNGGTSNRNLKQIFKANVQCFRSWKKNGLKPSLFTILRKPFSKLLQLR